MKKHIKILLFALVLCQLIGLFVSCVDKNQEEPAFELTKEQLANYSIVIPFYADHAVQNMANTLQSMIEQAIGKKLEIKKDYPIEGAVDPNETEYEILIGEVTRASVSAFYTGLKQKDAGYTLVGKKLLLLGYTSDALNKSVRHFKAEILDKIDALQPLLKAGDCSLVAGSYSYETLMINGTDIKNFKIVYPTENRKSESLIAASLGDWITDQTGYIIPVVSDEAEASDYEIQIGDTTRITDEMRAERTAAAFENGKYYIGKSNGAVWLSGNDRTALQLAFSCFLNMVTVSENTLSLRMDTPRCQPISEMMLSVMSYNVY